MVLDANFQKLYTNSTVFKLTGYTEEEFSSIQLYDIIHPSGQDQFHRHLLKSFNGTEKSSRFQTQLKCKNGDFLHLLVTLGIAEIPELGENFLFCTFVNMQQEKASEETLVYESRMEATATFAGGLAHENNNLMTGIMGHSQLMEMRLAKSPIHKSSLDAINRAAGKAGQLAHQLLAYARGGKYHVQEIDLNETVSTFCDQLSKNLPSSIKMEIALSTDLRKTKADPAQMSLLVGNLLKNAKEAIDESGTITVLTEDHYQISDERIGSDILSPGPYIRLIIRDDGEGIDPSIREKIFEPFFSTRFTGRGLGLSAALGIVQNHEGSISIRSFPGKGTAVHILLPALDSVEDVLASVDESHPLEGTETILVVDDEESILTTTRSLLKSLGYTVLLAGNGREAVEMLNKYNDSIHLALLDMKMPVLSGYEAFPLMQEARPEMKILISSGYDIDSQSQEILDNGAVGFLHKPYNLAKLTHTIRKVLD